MESIFQKIRRVGFGMFMLLHLLLLFNKIIFFHSHWYNGHLVAVHAHPYEFNSESPSGQDDGSHSKEELELYDLISNTPRLELEFFEFVLSPFHAESNDSIASILFKYEDNSGSAWHIRGPPSFS
ncbi:hypothetical protein [Mariniradius sediminis]|uniref:Transmembrane protein n=1 Tax=Mariniradius sediminis TaxID=2909237 RepID=A0ABS9BNA5_9BACT|nr:hypothetical protein [Mariniradius sediminis]MCF1749492.1 hypothetical protein [Mariniradius sediminis]